MKTNIIRLFCILLATVMVFAVAGCADENAGETPSDIEWTDADEVTDIDGDTGDIGDNGDAGDNGDIGGAGDTGNTGNTGDTKNTGKTESGLNGQGGNTNIKSGQNGTGSSKNLDSLSWSKLVSQIPARLKGTTVKVFSWNPAKHVTGAEKVIADFTKQTGIKVKWIEGSYDNYQQEILAKINSGTSPDIIRYQYFNIYRMELTQDARTATGQSFSGDIWDKELLKAFTIKGKIYGVNLKNTFNQQPCAVFYSKRVIDRYKMEDPYDLWKSGKWNFKKFSSMCLQFKKETGRNAWMTNYQLDLLDYNGLDLVTFDGKTFKSNASNPKVLNTLRQICTYRENLTCEAMRDQTLIENGTYLFTTDNMLCARRTDFHYPVLKEEDDLYCVPFPTLPGQTNYTRMHEYEAYGFPKGAKNAEAAYYFLRYYLNRDNYDAKTFFCNRQALEVYDALMKSGNKRFYKITRDVCIVTLGEDYQNCGLDNWMRLVANPDQIKSELERQKPNINRAVNAANAELKKFP